jgi:hypothetical protein
MMLVPSFPLEPSAARAEPAGVQPGEFVPAAGAAQTNRELVADESAATAGEACTLLLAFPGGRSSESAAVRGDAGSNRAAVSADRITTAGQTRIGSISSGLLG